MARTAFENLRVFRLSEDLADYVWDVVGAWKIFARDTVGKQLVRAADSIGANIAEGVGRGSYQETKYWLRRAYRRQLITAEQVAGIRTLLDELSPKLNAYLKSIGRCKTTSGLQLTTDN